MADFILTGQATDLILAVLAIECVVVSIYLLRRGRGMELRGFMASAAAGAALVLAIRIALTGGGWAAIGACLLISLVAHLAELVIRFRRQEKVSNPSGTGPTLQEKTREPTT